jgi:hypothetical protein
MEQGTSLAGGTLIGAGNKGGAWKVVGIVTLVVLVGVLAVGGFLVVDNMNKGQKIDDLASKIEELEKVGTDSGSEADSGVAEELDGYLVLKEWGLRFKVPEGLTDVRYVIRGDRVLFWGKPSGSRVELSL